MATTKTYTFVSGQVADATQVNKNFDDLLAGINAGVSATDKVLGRVTAGAGAVEEIPCTAAGRALLDDASATVQIATLGLDADIATLVLPANTTITAAGAAILDDATVGAILATIGGMPSAAGTVTLAQMANLAQDQIIGRATASTGVPEVIACTAAGRALLDDANAAAQMATLGAVATGDSRLSDARVASDVYAWAKAASPQSGLSYGASDALVDSFDSAVNSTGRTDSVYTKAKSIKVTIPGTYRVKFDLSWGTCGDMNGKVYINGSAVSGNFRNNTTVAYITYSGGDFAVLAGDTIELWCMASAANTSYYGSARDFRLYGTISSTPIFVHV